MASAVVNAIMAELVEAWYGERDAAWQRVRENTINPETGEYSDSQATRIAYVFWTSAETAQRDTATWLEIADNIEAKLKRLETANS
jgi:hypothetical protein